MIRVQKLKKLLLFSFFLICFCFLSSKNLFSLGPQVQAHPSILEPYLLPDKHPLQEQINHLFENSQMFESVDQLQKSGFEVLPRVHRGLMVASHSTMNGYLIKKFQNHISQKHQLNNYVSRIRGARALNLFISKNHLKHIIVPKKWLYALPKKFSDSVTKEKTYILIVEKLDILTGNGEVAKRYQSIEEPILKELCMVVYRFRGLDSVLHNMPFTHQNKIAFIDTEKWNIKRKGFLHSIMPFLSEDGKAYARSTYEELKK